MKIVNSTVTDSIWNGSAVPYTYGGTGGTSASAGITNLAGSATSGQYLRGNGTVVQMSAIQAADVPTLNQNSTGTSANFVNGFRLTTVSNTPIPVGDETSISTIYLTPFKHGNITLYNTTASAWQTYSSGQVSLALGTLTNAGIYDVFAYQSAGTVTLELSTLWTNTTTRANTIGQVNGVWVKTSGSNSDNSRLYLGTIKMTSTTTTEDSQLNRFVWNFYNQVQKPLNVYDSSSSWSYGTATWRQAHGSTSNQYNIVCGLSGFAGIRNVLTASANTTSGSPACAVGVNNTTPVGAYNYYANSYSEFGVGTAIYNEFPALGPTSYLWLEYASGTVSSFNGTESPSIRSGLSGLYDC